MTIFSDFFTKTPKEEQEKILKKVIHKSNQDQRKIMTAAFIQANFLRVVEGGHCLYCHKDINMDLYKHQMIRHPKEFKNFESGTSCNNSCKNSKFRVK